MARIGITYYDVTQAALQLQGQGKQPTVDRIREVLGTGSRTTIADHLKEWRAKQTDDHGKLPQELSALVTGLWERLQTQAEGRVMQMQTDYEKQLQDAQDKLHQAQKERLEIQQQLHQAVEEGVQKTQEKQVLQEQLQALQQAYARLEAQHHSAAQQIDDLKADNARLYQLSNQVQANLEHYQEAMQTLRTEQTLQAEKREADLQREIHGLDEGLSLARAKAAKLQEENQQLNYVLSQEKENHAILVQQARLFQQELQKATQEIAKLAERCLHVEQLLKAEKETGRQSQSQMKKLEKQVIICSEQRQQLETALRQAEDKIEALRHEKLFLVQEKSELQGALKQLKSS